ncbi:MAG: insulinase family protein [Gemmatimonadetes bacterium]|nr:insulinase family protein [Gemmatimonadota bacterium]
MPVPFEERRLDNGLRVLVHEDPSTPIVGIHWMVHVGSKHERPGRTGFAHLFEHLLFQGSENVPPGAHFTYVQDAGGTLNGSTWFDRTNYWEVVPVDALERVLWLESDRLGWFLPGLTAEKFETQRGVVRNERRQRYENQPYGLWLEKVLGLLYPAGHPYRHPTIGSMEDLAAATFEDARAFFETWYRPNNCALVLAGDVEADDAFARVERWFGAIEPGAVPEPPKVPAVRLEEDRLETVVEPVEVPRVYLAWHVPAWGRPGSHALDLLAQVLAGGRSGRLWRELVYHRRIAQDVSAFNWQPLEDTGLFLVVLTGKPRTEGAELLSAFDEILGRLATGGLAEGEATAAAHRVQLGLLHALNDVGGRADALAHAAVLLDDPVYVERQQAERAGVEADEIQEAARRWLAGASRAVVEYAPASP